MSLTHYMYSTIDYYYYYLTVTHSLPSQSQTKKKKDIQQSSLSFAFAFVHIYYLLPSLLVPCLLLYPCSPLSAFSASDHLIGTH